MSWKRWRLLVILWLEPSTWTVTGFVFVSCADLPSTSRTVTTGTTTSWSIAPPWTNRAPPVKWKRLAARGTQNSMSPSRVGRHLDAPVPGGLVVGEVVPDQVALLGPHRPLGLLVELGLLGLAGGRLGEQEAVVCRDDDVTPVEPVRMTTLISAASSSMAVAPPRTSFPRSRPPRRRHRQCCGRRRRRAGPRRTPGPRPASSPSGRSYLQTIPPTAFRIASRSSDEDVSTCHRRARPGYPL